MSLGGCHLLDLALMQIHRVFASDMSISQDGQLGHHHGQEVYTTTQQTQSVFIFTRLLL